MKKTDLKKPLTGEPLIDSILSAKEKRKPIVEGLIYQKTFTMVSGDPGLGKSTVTTQLAIEVSAGLPVFGALKVERPFKVLYIPAERDDLEFLERAEIISKRIPINKENLFLCGSYKVLNLLKEEHVKVFIESIMENCPGIELIIIDPIYPMVSGGLSKDEPASAFTKAMSLLQEYTGASLWYNHHNVKPSHDKDGKQYEKDDPFYGSQWLKAHCTGSFLLKRVDGDTKLIKKKDNYGILPKDITLEFDPETGLYSIPRHEMPPSEKVRIFLDAREVDSKPFSFKDLQKNTEISTASLRRIIKEPTIAERINVVNTHSNRNLYQIRKSKT